MASALALACVIAAVASGSGPVRRELETGVSEEVPMELMPDPAEAVHVAQETTTQVDPFHRDGSWIVPEEEDEEDVPKMIMEPRYAMREGQEAADHASRQPYNVPLERNGLEVPGVPGSALGQYTPRRQISNNPLAQFIPNITYWPNGDIVPFWGGECEEGDVECMLWKAKGYENGDVVLPNPREKVWTDPWGLPLKKFGADPKEGTAEDPLLLAMAGVEEEEEEEGVPRAIAEADALKVAEEVAEESGASPEKAQTEADNVLAEEKIVEEEKVIAAEAAEKKIEAEEKGVGVEGPGKAEEISKIEAAVAEEEKVAAESEEKAHELESSVAGLTGEPTAGEGVAEGGVPMITEAGPAGDIPETAEAVSEPVASGNVEMISPVFKGPVSAGAAIPVESQTYTQAGAIAGAAAAMSQVRAAQLQRAKVAGYLLKPMYTTP